jgi:hypothetical protein
MASGLVRGFEQGHGFFGTLESMASGAARGAVAGGEEGMSAAGDVGQAVGTAVGDVLGGTEALALLALASPLFLTLDVAVATHMDKWLAHDRSRASAVGAPGGAPTHSQLAKDAPEHAVFATSRALAVHADTLVGGAVREVWTNPDKDKAVERVLPLVDQLVAHPSVNRPLWESALRAALAQHRPA